MKQVLVAAALSALAFSFYAPSASAHFGMTIPSASVIETQADAAITVTFAFAHPMEGEGMTLAMPEAVQVVCDGESTDVAGLLKPAAVMEHDAFVLDWKAARPGVYQFAMTPQAYWEPAEDCFIKHYTKTVISVFGEEEGWDEPVGFKTEIIPLTRPFGNYAGNIFQGKVLLDGKAVPGCEVEVEYYNREGKYEAPNAALVTQVVKTDDNGVFAFAAPFAGWWGFAALNTADEKMTRDGEEKDVELGAVLWTEFSAPKPSGN